MKCSCLDGMETGVLEDDQLLDWLGNEMIIIHLPAFADDTGLHNRKETERTFV